MYAIIVSGGKQHRVARGDLLRIEQITADVGAVVELDKVLMIANEGSFTVGKPYLADAKVVVEVMEHGRGAKVYTVKFRRRKHYMKRQGHRQNYTAVKVNDIVGG